MSGPNGHSAHPDAPAELRARMVDEQLRRRGIRDPRVLDAMLRVERHHFAPEAKLGQAYGDFPVPIGHGQTLSQPYIVALMTESLELAGSERVLEIGTGSGYQTAVLARLVPGVFTVEFVEALSREARARLEALGCDNVRFRVGDGKLGWPEAAPFHAILVTAAPEYVPEPLLEQLAEGGRLVIPVGGPNQQELELVTRDGSAPGGYRKRGLGAVRFVPLV